MTYTIDDINRFVEIEGWDVEFTRNGEKIVKHQDGWDSFSYRIQPPRRWNEVTKTHDVEPFDGFETPFGHATLVEDYGGEGEGDQYWFVFKVTNPGDERLFRRNGWYASYEGGYYEGPTEEVKPVVRPVTFFEPI